MVRLEIRERSDSFGVRGEQFCLGIDRDLVRGHVLRTKVFPNRHGPGDHLAFARVRFLDYVERLRVDGRSRAFCTFREILVPRHRRVEQRVGLRVEVLHVDGLLEQFLLDNVLGRDPIDALLGDGLHDGVVCGDVRDLIEQFA